ncbi:aromatase [Streptomyces achromogenes]|nr:aromatase [Streptomyces achromogenes]
MARDAATVTTEVSTESATDGTVDGTAEVTVDGTTEVTHRIEVSAPASAVYRIVAEVGLWPLYFPPTVRAERTGGDETDERIRIWALANGELRTWESRRRLDPAGLRIEFEQIEPREPVAAMGGTWRVTERPDGGCTVELDHFYRAVDGDPVAHERISRAVDTNSRSELEHLRRAAERGDAERELLFDFADTETFTGSIEEAYAFIYEASRWPERLPHVARLELREEETGLQFMEMDTRSPDGSLHTTASGRVCEPLRRITYKQTILPPVLHAHNGEWRFEEGPDGTVKVTSYHQVLLDPAGIDALPDPPKTLADARQAVRHALGSNSRATMAKARAFVQAG